MTSAQVTGMLIWGIVALVGVLALIGMGFAFSLFETYRSRGWVETPCTIKLSQMDRKPNGKMYWNVVYSYTIDGQEYTSKRFELLEFDSEHWSDIADLVDQFPMGRQSVCFVDPNDPENAILSKRIRRFVYLAWVPVAVMAVGLIGVALQIPRPEKAIPIEPAEEVDPVDTQDDEEPKKGSLKYFDFPARRHPVRASSPSSQTALRI